MQLGRPEGLWLLSLLVPLVALYLLKSPRKPARVSAVWLWRAADRDLLAKRPFRKLKSQVPLILEALAIATLALAASQPSSSGRDPLVKHLAIVLDISASMQARQADGQTRLSAAKQIVEERLSSLPSGAEVLLVTAGKRARVVSPLERDPRRLLAPLRRVEGVDADGSLVSAVGLSASRLRPLAGEKRLLIVTDGALADESPIATSGIPTEIVRVGAPKDNTGIVRVVAKSESDEGRSSWPVHVFVSVRNYGRTVRNLYATLRQRNVDEPLASRQLQLAPGEQAPVVLSFDAVKSDEGTGLVVDLSPQDDFVVDDVAYATVPPMNRQPVLLSPAEGSPWLRRALLADADIDLRGVSPEELQTLRVPRGALVIYSGYCPKTAPPSNYLIVAPPGGDCLLDGVSEQKTAAKVISWKDTDPRLRFLSLGGLQVSAARALRVDSPDRVLVRSEIGALMTRQTLFGREGTVVGFDFGQSEWPREASFVLFVRNLVEMARTARRGAASGGHSTGDPYRLSVPQDVASVQVLFPSGTQESIPARSGIAKLPSVDRAGFYYFSWQGSAPGSALVAANLTAEKEGNLIKQASPELYEGAHTAPKGSDRIVDWSWLLCGLGLLLLMLDLWFVTQRSGNLRGHA